VLANPERSATDLTGYRNGDREKERIASLLSLLPRLIESALDVGARDGHVSRLLAERFPRVTALDLERPSIDHERIVCVRGDVRAMELPAASAELVLCTEVLEHIPAWQLSNACGELSRVSSRYVLVGVPYKQDTRVGRTTCGSCGEINPPWGHVNCFDEDRLRQLFHGLRVARTSFVGVADARTNALACRLMDLAGNPFGTYSQDEPCVHCGVQLTPPPERTLRRKVLTRLAFYAQDAQRPFMRRRPNWIHVLFEKQSSVVRPQHREHYGTRPVDQYAGTRSDAGEYASAELDK
jgi:hypothetical protein